MGCATHIRKHDLYLCEHAERGMWRAVCKSQWLLLVCNTCFHANSECNATWLCTSFVTAQCQSVNACKAGAPKMLYLPCMSSCPDHYTLRQQGNRTMMMMWVDRCHGVHAFQARKLQTPRALEYGPVFLCASHVCITHMHVGRVLNAQD